MSALPPKADIRTWPALRATALAAWRCSPRLPVSLLGLALGLVVVMRVFLCTIGSAFRHPIPFRNPRRLVKRFVSAPFLFAGR